MKYMNRPIIGMLVAGIALAGTSELYARGTGGRSVGYHSGGWSGNRAGGSYGGGERFNSGHELNRDRDRNRADHIRPDPDNRDHPRPAPPAPPPPPTYNVNINAPESGWYGASDDAMAGMVMGTMIGAAAARNRDSQPTTVIVEEPPVVVAGPVTMGSQMATLPAGSQARTVNGMIYYQNRDVWYRPYFGPSGVYYEVVAPPKTAGK